MSDIKDELVDALEKALRQWKMYYESQPAKIDPQTIPAMMKRQKENEGAIYRDKNSEATTFQDCMAVLAKTRLTVN